MRAASKHLKAQDLLLAHVISEIGPCKLAPAKKYSPYEALAESIAYQQLNGKAAAAIWSRVIDLYGGKKLGKPAEVLKTRTLTLRKAGLSESKVLALKDLAAKAEEGLVPTWTKLEKLEDEEIIEMLTSVRGIGPWTVQMMLIFQMGRPDVLPTTDFGVQKGFQLTYGLPDMPKPKQLLEAGEIWKPHRSIASWYLWRAVDLFKQRGLDPQDKRRA